MERVVYVNGAFVAESEAVISVFDRGFLFADGVYEVSAVIAGKLIDNRRHLARLERSLAQLRMRLPIPLEEIESAQCSLVDRNQLREGAVYLQVTRGVAERDFGFRPEMSSTLVMFTQARALLDTPLARRGARVQVVPETRWAHRDIKTIQLLAASLAKQTAVDDGYDDAWFVEEGFITEATAANAYILSPDGVIVTRKLGSEILPGVTRQAVLETASRRGLAVEERAFTVEEAYQAAEAFMTSATAMITPVVAIDQHVLGDGTPGQVTRTIREDYLRMITS